MITINHIASPQHSSTRFEEKAGAKLCQAQFKLGLAMLDGPLLVIDFCGCFWSKFLQYEKYGCYSHIWDIWTRTGKIFKNHPFLKKSTES
jgi:hypothetical protein